MDSKTPTTDALCGSVSQFDSTAPYLLADVAALARKLETDRAALIAALRDARHALERAAGCVRMIAESDAQAHDYSAPIDVAVDKAGATLAKVRG